MVDYTAHVVKRLVLSLLFLAAVAVGSALPPAWLYPRAARWATPPLIERCRVIYTPYHGTPRCVKRSEEQRVPANALTARFDRPPWRQLEREDRPQS